MEAGRTRQRTTTCAITPIRRAHSNAFTKYRPPEKFPPMRLQLINIIQDLPHALYNFIGLWKDLYELCPQRLLHGSRGEGEARNASGRAGEVGTCGGNSLISSVSIGDQGDECSGGGEDLRRRIPKYGPRLPSCCLFRKGHSNALASTLHTQSRISCLGDYLEPICRKRRVLCWIWAFWSCMSRRGGIWELFAEHFNPLPAPGSKDVRTGNAK
jgi:hypothetical protein